MLHRIILCIKYYTIICLSENEAPNCQEVNRPTVSPLIIIIIKNEKIRVTLCENAAGALYIVNNT